MEDDLEIEISSEMPSHHQCKRIDGNGKDDVQRYFFNASNACDSFIEPSREVTKEAANTWEKPQDNYQRWKGKIHPRSLWAKQKCDEQ